MSSGVALQSLANGVVFLGSPGGIPSFGSSRTLFVYQRGNTTQVQVYQDQALTTPIPGGQPLTTDALGIVPGYVVPGQSIDFFDVLSSERAEGEPFLAGGLVSSSGIGGSPVVLSGSLVNTQTILQSIGGADPTHVVDPWNPTPVALGIASAGTYSDSSSGSILQLLAWAANSGTRATVGLSTWGLGPHSWAENPVGLSNDSGSLGVSWASEMDAGYYGSGTGNGGGLYVVCTTGNRARTGTWLGSGIRITGGGDSLGDQNRWANGIIFRGNAVDSTAGSLLASDSLCAPAWGINFGEMPYTVAAAVLSSMNGLDALVLQADASDASNGILLHLLPKGGGKAKYGIYFDSAVVSNSAITFAASTPAAIGIDFSAPTFPSAAIALGDNNVTIGTVTGVQWGHTSSVKQAWYGKTPVTQPVVTGSRSGGAALTSLLSALNTLGLVLDTTTS